MVFPVSDILASIGCIERATAKGCETNGFSNIILVSPNEKAKDLKVEIKFNAMVDSLYIDSEKNKTTVKYYDNSPGKQDVTKEPETFDYVIVTVPLGNLQMWKIDGAIFSIDKTRAIRTIHYAASTKILLQYKTRWWEKRFPKMDNGGGITTDLPLRTIYFPPKAHNGDYEGGVVLASYTWEQDGLRWGALSNEERITYARNWMKLIFPESDAVFERGTSHSWYQTREFAGAFTYFFPGQWTSLYRHITQPETNVYFAGEHASVTHGWIQGAMESALDACLSISTKHGGKK